MLETLLNVLMVLLLVLGFGFVIFWHELGHFLAAKWVGIRVEQFAVGFGQAILAWRKGIGVRVGTTRHEYERRILARLRAEHPDAAFTAAEAEEADAAAAKEAKDKEDDGEEVRHPFTSEQMDKAADELGLGETEYRLNWIPLGGYVKMLEQDDLKQVAASGDPRAYPNKSVGARMFVISAGVIMNIILAAIGFMVLFLMGHNVPPAQIAGMTQGSPAQNVTRVSDGSEASLQVGDTILYYDNQWMWDWTKVGLNVALSHPDEPTMIHVRHVDGSEETFLIKPAKEMPGSDKFLTLGFDRIAPMTLRGPDPKKTKIPDEKWDELVTDDAQAIKPGDVITHVNGQPVDAETDYYKLDRIVQEAKGKPVTLTILRHDGGKSEPVQVQPHFVPPFGNTPLHFAGLMPRASVTAIQPKSPARGKLMPGDAIAQIVIGSDPTRDPSGKELLEIVNKAGKAGQPIEMTVVRDGKTVVLPGLTPNVKVGVDEAGNDRYGLSIAPGFDEATTVVGGVVPNSPAAAAGIPKSAVIQSVDGKPVSNWYDVQTALESAEADRPIAIVYKDVSGTEVRTSLKLSADELAYTRQARYALTDVLHSLDPRIVPRVAANPAQAAWWGVTETRDFVLQFYVTIQRMIGGSVSPKNLMGPVGIFQHGAGFAFKGTDWLIWFLAMISANLAVVNFLPIPVVDGGHFVFLLVEKFRGRPVSPKVQSVAQIVGLALLLGIFLFVTYQDIGRMLTPGVVL